MNRFVLLTICLLFSGFPVAAVEETPTPVAPADDLNYSYGYQLGRELLASGVALRPEALFQAIYAALDKEKPEISKGEMAILLEILKVESQ